MQLTSDQLAQIEKNLSLIRDHVSLVAGTNSAQTLGIWAYLQQSETELIELMDGKQPVLAGSEVEWGLSLYTANNALPSWMTDVLKTLGMPASQITSQMLGQWQETLSAGGVVSGDGTLIAETTWSAMDPGWVMALTYYLVYWLNLAQAAPFGQNPKTIPLDGSSTVRIALVSDWGTGSWTDGSAACPSASVMNAIQKLAPDFVVHLGDVYYAGTRGEESGNLTGPFQTASLTGFTLNSNHEMYDGANGYFNTALDSGGPFSKQNGASYFALTWNDVVIIGLDSAYFDTSVFFMNGSLIDPGQLTFIKGLKLTAANTTIVLTHHNGLTADGTAQTGLWSQVVKALAGTPPNYWYWGHVHNGIVYSAQSTAGPDTNARCIGHGALPFGNGYGLHESDGSNISSITYYAHDAFPNPDSQQVNRVLNGFAMLTLTPPNSITEEFYDQDGNLVWPPAAGD